jgi:ligand-binding sensor domain-containing protein
LIRQPSRSVESDNTSDTMPTTSRDSVSRRQALRVAAFLFALFALPASSQAQNRFEWSVYSALNAVQSVAIDTAGTIWAGTTGGVVGYHPASDSFEVYRTTEGLMTLNTTAVGVDPAGGDLYAGAADGSISIRSADGAWHGVTDISGVERADRRIKDFRFHGGMVFVLTSFGVAVFDPSDTTFPETWTRFGALPPNIAVNDIVFWRDSVWLATDRGIARAPQRGALLPNPLSWTVFDSSSGYSGE